MSRTKVVEDDEGARRPVRSGGTCITVRKGEERIHCVGGWESYWHLDEYLCASCGRLVEGEFAGTYIGSEATTGPSWRALRGPCFWCLLMKTRRIKEL